MDITIQAPELRRLQRKYQRAPEIVGEELARAVEASTLHAEGEIVERTPVNRSRLRNSINSTQERQGDTYRGIVQTGNVPYAVPVEIGRQPGTMPPVDAIQRWVHDKGLGGRTRVVSRGPNAGQERLTRAPQAVERRIAWAIALKIKRDGIKGKHMFRDGAKAAEPFIRREFGAVTVRVARRLESMA